MGAAGAAGRGRAGAAGRPAGHPRPRRRRRRRARRAPAPDPAGRGAARGAAGRGVGDASPGRSASSGWPRRPSCGCSARGCPACCGTGRCCRCPRCPASWWCSAPTCCCGPRSARRSAASRSRPAWSPRCSARPVLVWLARRYRDSGPARPAAGGALVAAARPRRVRRRARRWPARRSPAPRCVGLLLGDALLLLGDVANWVTGPRRPVVTFVLDQRVCRGCSPRWSPAPRSPSPARSSRRCCRNPLAEPGLLGVTGGAGLGAVAAHHPGARRRHLGVTGGPRRGGALAVRCWSSGSRCAAGWSSDRLVLIGVGVSAAADALITVIIVLTDPWNTPRR